MRRLWLALCALLLGGCSATLDPSYYWQSVSGLASAGHGGIDAS